MVVIILCRPSGFELLLLLQSCAGGAVMVNVRFDGQFFTNNISNIIFVTIACICAF